MKKILAFFVLMALGTNLFYAQISEASSIAKKNSRIKKTSEKNQNILISKKSSTKAKTPQSKRVSPAGIQLKKDGTPDKRYRSVSKERPLKTSYGDQKNQEIKKNNEFSERTLSSNDKKKSTPSTTYKSKEAIYTFNKDGTPDMRLKKNRRQGYNKDGSLDMRYKANQKNR